MTRDMAEQAASIDVAIIGGGPSGLAAACALKEAGIKRVVVFEREAEAGGIPRHCGHPPFGMREFKRILKGPDYAARLVARALSAGVEIQTLTTVVKALPKGVLMLSSCDGVRQISPRRVIYATGVRETSRASRLISGARGQGVVNTGALQSMVYLKGRRPFSHPVILGSELVAFSAIMTCRYAGIQPKAMIEFASCATARWPSALFAPLKGVALLRNTDVLEIVGTDRVEAVVVAGADGKERRIECDGVVLSGQFTPESALARRGHLAVDDATGGPKVDQWGRCSDPAYFATGNLLRAVETAGQSWAEGCRTGQWVARDLVDQLPDSVNVAQIDLGDTRLKYAMPQRLCLSGNNGDGMTDIQLRVKEPVSGALVACTQGGAIWRQRLNARPERRISVPITQILATARDEKVTFLIE